MFDDTSLYDPPKGLDWTHVETTFKAPTVYDPPQLKPNYYRGWRIGYIAPRSRLCAWPTVPCCCMCCCSCCDCGLEYVDIADPDAWFTAMLRARDTSSKFPADKLGGIFWMQDNTAPETLVTFHDANWVSTKLGLKLGKYNWTHDTTCFGTVMTTGTAAKQAQFALRVEISPNGKWVLINTPDARTNPKGTEPVANTIWGYFLQAGDKVYRSDGEEVPWAPGDWMRITYEQPFDQKSPVSYQYMARRVAYLDASGSLVKTDAYDTLLKQCMAPEEPPPTCCGYSYCNYTAEEFPKRALGIQNRYQNILFAPSQGAMA